MLTREGGHSERGDGAMVNEGLYHKYNIERTDGSSAMGGKHYACGYFVLDISHDRHAQPALVAYAKACREENPQLADDILNAIGWVDCD